MRRLDKNRLQFHGATAAMIFALTIVNGLSLMRPLPSGKSNSNDKNGGGIFDVIRGPAAVIGTESTRTTEPSAEVSDALMAEAHIECGRTKPVAVAITVRQIRLILDGCNNPVVSVINETNGFQATLFEQKATDYMTLAPEQNTIKISRTGVVESLLIERY